MARLGKIGRSSGLIRLLIIKTANPLLKYS